VQPLAQNKGNKLQKPHDIDYPSDSDAAYTMAIEHTGWAMWQGLKPWQVMVSVGVAAPTDASWNQALGVIWQKAGEI